MKWNEIIVERKAASIKNESDLDNALAQCPLMVSKLKGTGLTLYRGMTDSSRANNYEENVNIMPKVYEKICDDYLKSQFGLGRKSYYGTGDIQQSEIYGDPYAILLSDDADIVWSPKVNDFHSEDFMLDMQKDPQNLYIVPNLEIADADPSWYGFDSDDEFFQVAEERNWYSVANIQAHIRAGLVTPEKWNNTKEWLKKHVTGLGYRSGDIVAALQSGNEIMFTASQIFAVPEKLIPALQNRLN